MVGKPDGDYIFWDIHGLGYILFEGLGVRRCQCVMVQDLTWKLLNGIEVIGVLSWQSSWCMIQVFFMWLHQRSQLI